MIDYKNKVGKCFLCGWNKNTLILQLHHKDKSKKSFKLMSGTNFYGKSWKIILKEIKKCNLLCPNCHAIYHYLEKDWFKKNAILKNGISITKHGIWQRKTIIKKRQKLIDLKRIQGNCEICGWNKMPEIFIFHHKNESNKRFNIGRANIANYSDKTINAELKKCIMICPTCHFIIHINDNKRKH